MSAWLAWLLPGGGSPPPTPPPDSSSLWYAAGIAVSSLLLVWLLSFPVSSFVLRRRFSYAGRHVLVTGGSKGLGLALAQQLAVDHNAQVSVCCRTQADLSAATQTIRDLLLRHTKHTGRIQGFVCDVTDYAACQKMIADAERSFGPVGVLINCAGRALPGLFADQPLEQYESTMRLNYLGSVYCTRVVVSNAIVRHAEDAQLEHKIVFVASQAGLMSCAGYASYSPSKFAVRGLAECLRNELLPYRIGVAVAFPGNMDTPGYEEEQRCKPEATKNIEAMEALQKPDEVARAMLDSLAKHEFALYGGNVSGYFLGRMSHGLAPNGTSLVVDAVLAPILVFAAWAHRVLVLDRAVWQVEAAAKKDKKAKAE